ncbi:hypothetical protein SK128_016558 [Halocaridina rubra]|uniref:Uncharacterized protein n=1 Tax=Halocaridina rubra TaxID=373956 RepID=A0AAN8XQN4_HALRR
MDSPMNLKKYASATASHGKSINLNNLGQILASRPHNTHFSLYNSGLSLRPPDLASGKPRASVYEPQAKHLDNYTAVQTPQYLSFIPKVSEAVEHPNALASASQAYDLDAALKPNAFASLSQAKGQIS